MDVSTRSGEAPPAPPDAGQAAAGGERTSVSPRALSPRCTPFVPAPQAPKTRAAAAQGGPPTRWTAPRPHGRSHHLRDARPSRGRAAPPPPRSPSARRLLARAQGHEEEGPEPAARPPGAPLTGWSRRPRRAPRTAARCSSAPSRRRRRSLGETWRAPTTSRERPEAPAAQSGGSAPSSNRRACPRGGGSSRPRVRSAQARRHPIAAGPWREAAG